MEAPEPIICKIETLGGDDKPKEEFNIKLNKEQNNYLETILKLYSSYILIIVFYEKDLSKEEFQKKFYLNDFTKNKYLAGCDSIDDVFEQLKFEFKKNNIKINQEKDMIKINIPIDYIKVKELIFELPKKQKSEKEKIDILFNEIMNLKKEINDLRNDNKILKDDNKILKDEIKNLKELFEKYISSSEKNKKSLSNKLSFDSIIIKNNDEKKNSIIKWIEEKTKKNVLNLELIYKMTKDGNKGEDFHRCCDNKGATLTLIKTNKNYIFGGFTPLIWDKTSSQKKDLSNQTFIFSLDLMKKYDMINYHKKAIICENNGPIFGDWDFGLNYNMKNGETYANSFCNFLSNNNLELTMEKGESKEFITEECEVYKVIFAQ